MLLQKVSGAVQPRSVTHRVISQHSQGLQINSFSFGRHFFLSRDLFVNDGPFNGIAYIHFKSLGNFCFL